MTTEKRKSLPGWSWRTVSVLFKEAVRMFTESGPDPGCHPWPWLGSAGVIDAAESEAVMPRAQSTPSPGRRRRSKRRGGWAACTWRVMAKGVMRMRGWSCSLGERPERGDRAAAGVRFSRLRLTPTSLWCDPWVSDVNGHQCDHADVKTRLWHRDITDLKGALCSGLCS